MGRNLAAEEQNLSIVTLCYIEPVDGEEPIRFTNAYSMEWNGHRWVGLGNFGKITAVEEDAELKMTGISITISGIPTTVRINTVLREYVGKICIVYVAPIDEQYLIAEPIVVFKGKIDVIGMEYGNETFSINMTVESQMAEWKRSRISRFTNEDQQIRYPGDLGLQFVSKVAEQEIFWGRT